MIASHMPSCVSRNFFFVFVWGGVSFLYIRLCNWKNFLSIVKTFFHHSRWKLDWNNTNFDLLGIVRNENNYKWRRHFTCNYRASLWNYTRNMKSFRQTMAKQNLENEVGNRMTDNPTIVSSLPGFTYRVQVKLEGLHERFGNARPWWSSHNI